jgi:hypothetical protein
MIPFVHQHGWTLVAPHVMWQLMLCVYSLLLIYGW